jgi:hypothetical protein
MMTTSVRPICPGTHPALVTEVERRSLAGELRQCLLSLSSRSKDRRIQNLRKGLYRQHNKAPDTIASLLTEAFNSQRDNPDKLASTIRDFFSARVKTLRRTLRQLSPVFTRDEGELNCTKVAIDQGDQSTPTLKRFIEEIDETMDLLMQMRAAAAWELYHTEHRA